MGHEGPFSRVQFHPSRLDIPLHWKKPRRIFVCSMGDLFHEDVPMDWVIENVLRVVEHSPRHIFMFLTKRPKRMRAVMEHYYRTDIDALGFEVPLENLYLGVTAENQEMADQRIPILLQTPAAKRFVSVEPMLGPVVLESVGRHLLGPASQRRGMNDGLDWVICGPENAPRPRPMDIEWARSLRDQARSAGVPFFMKTPRKGTLPADLAVQEFLNG
jgi:protein gp37